MKTNEDFLKFFEEKKDKLVFIKMMKEESQPEYYIRTGYFAHNDELTELKRELNELKFDVSLFMKGIVDNKFAVTKEMNENMKENALAILSRIGNVL